MPVYAYRCRACAASFDRRVAVDDRHTPQLCPTCAAPGTRVLTPDFAFRMAPQGILNARHLRQPHLGTV